ncbi:phosphorylated adapter RNA export protein-like [Anneissia japonica]|uniref:phosphorylated adapter RNA export protein-like n=1 Tax=Anneissia japonica TaxID=1529436 RepID=UPI0014258A7E|nr:phosphorylated adapter RNA export protein-like [Anneissia japonica]
MDELISETKNIASDPIPSSVSCEMEEGELSDSGDETIYIESKHKISPVSSFQCRSSYRSVIETDEDDSDSDAESITWKRKKQKVCQQQRSVDVQDIGNDIPKPPVIPKRNGIKKINNVWGAVIQEQTEKMVSSQLTTFGLDFSANRGVESYNHERSLETPTALPFGSYNQDALPHRKVPQAVVEDDDWFGESAEPCVNSKDIPDDTDDGMVVNVKEDNSTKPNVKRRLGKRPEHLPSVVARRMKIDPSDEIKVVAGKIAYSLWEPKRHLVLKTVEMIGTEKSTEIYNRAIEIEEGGGMLINNQSRRRSPGGVFFYLLRNSYGFETKLLDEIFDADCTGNEQKWKKTKKKRKKPGKIQLLLKEVKKEKE